MKTDKTRKIIREFMKEKVLLESSLKRIEHWVNSKDIAGITAFRSRLTNVTDNTLIDIKLEKEYTKKQNIQRNRELKASLLYLDYGVTKIAGSFVEDGGTEVQEESFIVVNLNDDPNFKDKIFKLSEYYNQDAFLYKPVDSDEAYLIGSNNSEFPGYGVEVPQGKFQSKVNARFMSRLGPQGFAFTNDNNPSQTHTKYTFQDRKNYRIRNGGIREVLNIDIIDDLSFGARYVCEMLGKSVIKKLIE
jgi:hypothetical protein